MENHLRSFCFIPSPLKLYKFNDKLEFSYLILLISFCRFSKNLPA